MIDFSTMDANQIVDAIDVILADYNKTGDRAMLLNAVEQGRFALWRLEDDGVSTIHIRAVRSKVSAMAKLSLVPLQMWGVFHEDDETFSSPFDGELFPSAELAAQKYEALLAAGTDLDGWGVVTKD